MRQSHDIGECQPEGLERGQLGARQERLQQPGSDITSLAGVTGMPLCGGPGILGSPWWCLVPHNRYIPMLASGLSKARTLILGDPIVLLTRAEEETQATRGFPSEGHLVKREVPEHGHKKLLQTH